MKLGDCHYNWNIHFYNVNGSICYARLARTDITQNFFPPVPKLGSVVVTPIQGGRALRIEWTLEYTGGSPITEFYAVVTSQDGTVQQFDLDIESTSQEISGLEPQTEYTVSLIVANEVGPATDNPSPQPIVTARGQVWLVLFQSLCIVFPRVQLVPSVLGCLCMHLHVRVCVHLVICTFGTIHVCQY